MRWIHACAGLIVMVASQCALAQGFICSPNPCVDPPMPRQVPNELVTPKPPRVMTTEQLQKLGFVTGIKGTGKGKQPADQKEPAKPDEKSGAKRDASTPAGK